MNELPFVVRASWKVGTETLLTSGPETITCPAPKAMGLAHSPSQFQLH
jgi:hypothetical protein